MAQDSKTVQPPPEMREKQPQPPPTREEKPDNNLTISTKLSTEQLICKTPQDSPNVSVKSLKNEGAKRRNKNGAFEEKPTLLYLAALQILFGILMAVFGVLVIIHSAKLAKIGGGLWGGCLGVASGTTGVLATARHWCPLKKNAQKIAHTAFLALSLVSIAVSQLVFVFAATGLARDVNKSEFLDGNEVTTPSPPETFSSLPPNYMALLSNVGLLIVSGISCVCAALAAYKSSRALCPCFRDEDGMNAKAHQCLNGKDAFVSSWLGKHSLPPPLYVVAAPASTGKRSKLSNGSLRLAPVLQLPPPVLSQPQIIGYPLIPAPLGPVPSPIIHAHPKEKLHRRHKRYPPQHKVVVPEHKKKVKKYKERQITTEDVARTYTGLDRTIAEEFIEICDSRNMSLCSNSSCQSCCNNSGCSACTSSSNTTNSELTCSVEKL